MTTTKGKIWTSSDWTQMTGLDTNFFKPETTGIDALTNGQLSNAYRELTTCGQTRIFSPASDAITATIMGR